MIYKNFTSDIKVSSIVLGTDVYGTDVDIKTSFELLNEYTFGGGNTIDTARLYGGGASEETIGKWMKEKNNRHSVIISSKCSHPPVENMKKSRLSRSEIFSDVEKSLLALGTDYIDILWLHRDDESLETEAITDALNDLVSQGKIRSFGASNWKAKRIIEANKSAVNHEKKGFSGSQIKWCIAHSSPNYKDDPTLVEMNKEEYGLYKNSGLCIFAYASQAKGFFYKLENGGTDALSPKAKQRYLSDENLRLYSELKKLCRDENISLTSAVLSALTSNTDFETAAIVGCKNTDQLKTTLEASDARFPYEKTLELLKY